MVAEWEIFHLIQQLRTKWRAGAWHYIFVLLRQSYLGRRAADFETVKTAVSDKIGGTNLGGQAQDNW